MNLPTSIPSTDTQLLALVDRVQQAAARKTALCLRGSGSKRFYGEAEQGEPLDLRGLNGVSSYEPTELVVTVRAGTPLAELEALLAGQGQCLAFEPPRFGPAEHGGGAVGGTVGGMVAAGLAGPSRAAVGSVRDYVLGASVLNGRGEVLSFGGQVMKNVAGYDLARVFAGSLGTLGVILEVSLKVLPVAPARATLAFDLKEAEALATLNRWSGQPLPVNASAWTGGRLHLRLAGAAAAVASAVGKLGGDRLGEAEADAHWASLRDQHHAWFQRAQAEVARTDSPATLWRLGLPDTARPIQLPELGADDQLIEWQGAQRWILSRRPASEVRTAAAAAGGHATLWQGQDRSAGVFTPLAPANAQIQQRLKASFDPAGIFNPGRLYPARVHAGL